MKFIPIGIAPEADFASLMNASDFSDKTHDGVQLRKTPNEKLVLIMHSRKSSPMDWKVVWQFSEVYFRTFEEAVAFCEDHGMKLMEGGR